MRRAILSLEPELRVSGGGGNFAKGGVNLVTLWPNVPFVAQRALCGPMCPLWPNVPFVAQRAFPRSEYSAYTGSDTGQFDTASGAVQRRPDV